VIDCLLSVYEVIVDWSCGIWRRLKRRFIYRLGKDGGQDSVPVETSL
jgi:hypothetical protein